MVQDGRSLEELRRELDGVTQEIVRLLRRRLELCGEVQRAKRATSTPTLDLGREEELVSRFVGATGSPQDRVLVRLLREIISACRGVQGELVVAVPQVMRSHSMEAARSVFGSSVSFSPAGGVEEAFRSVEVGSADFCVAPYESTTRGGYPSTLDALIESEELRIVGEVVLPVEYHLVSAEGSLGSVRFVAADVEAVWACQRFLYESLPWARVVYSANQPLSPRRGWAYLVGAREAEDSGLRVLAPHVEDERDNATRFIVVGRRGGFNVNFGGNLAYRTTVVFTAQNRPGMLAEILWHFGSKGINLTMIGSRPLRKKRWEYAFIVDLDTAEQNPAFVEALGEAQPKTTMLRVLGSYPKITSDRPRADMGK